MSDHEAAPFRKRLAGALSIGALVTGSLFGVEAAAPTWVPLSHADTIMKSKALFIDLLVHDVVAGVTAGIFYMGLTRPQKGDEGDDGGSGEPPDPILPRGPDGVAQEVPTPHEHSLML